MPLRSAPMIPPLRAAQALLAALLLALPGLAQATTMYEFNHSELTYVADLVAEAVVESASPERVEGSLFLRTVTDLRLVQVHKGDLMEGDIVTLPLIGGALNGEQTTLPSAARFTPGERVLVFLETWEEGWRPIGMSQGVWTLVEEPGSGQDLLLKVQRDYDLPAFDEAQVQLPPPAQRKYAAPLLQQIRSEVLDAHVPTYEPIPGLPAQKDRRFKKDALAHGQWIDPRAFKPGELSELTTELRGENR